MPHLLPAGKEAISDRWGVVKRIVEVEKNERERVRESKEMLDKWPILDIDDCFPQKC